MCANCTAIAGLSFAIASAYDAFADPIVGSIVDLTLSRRGRYRPYMLFGAVPLALQLWGHVLRAAGKRYGPRYLRDAVPYPDADTLHGRQSSLSRHVREHHPQTRQSARRLPACAWCLPRVRAYQSPCCCPRRCPR
ncbi:MFS transporter [Cupriavidus basilensis]